MTCGFVFIIKVQFEHVVCVFYPLPKYGRVVELFMKRKYPKRLFYYQLNFIFFNLIDARERHLSIYQLFVTSNFHVFIKYFHLGC